jgi:hypothetical protein
MISISMYDMEVGVQTCVFPDGDVAHRYVAKRKNCGTEVIKIEGDRETIRDYLLICLDSTKGIIGDKMAYFLIRNIDEIIDNSKIVTE